MRSFPPMREWEQPWTGVSNTYFVRVYDDEQIPPLGLASL